MVVGSSKMAIDLIDDPLISDTLPMVVGEKKRVDLFVIVTVSRDSVRGLSFPLGRLRVFSVRNTHRLPDHRERAFVATCPLSRMR